MIHHPVFLLVILLLFAGVSVAAGAIDLIGALAGILIGMGMYLGGGWPLLILLLAFFVSGSLATRWKMAQKQSVGLAEAKRGKRSAINALSNAGVAAGIGLISGLTGGDFLVWEIMMAGSIASATSDTLSSELGNLYGSRYINILTFRAGERGKDGVISPEGTFFGLLGSGIIALSYTLLTQQYQFFWPIALAGMAGNLFDSVLGAGIQPRGMLSNHGVNFVSTFFAALIAGILYLVNIH